ncbi:MAG: hypothetical protein FWE40_01100 [Oscillospiraceae bacterium]|nr:hypothetical protein [Oscillospiraceae bacterium]
MMKKFFKTFWGDFAYILLPLIFSFFPNRFYSPMAQITFGVYTLLFGIATVLLICKKKRSFHDLIFIIYFAFGIAAIVRFAFPTPLCDDPNFCHFLRLGFRNQVHMVESIVIPITILMRVVVFLIQRHQTAKRTPTEPRVEDNNDSNEE